MLAFGAEHLSAELQSPRGSSACGTGALGTDGRMIEEAIVHPARTASAQKRIHPSEQV
jgi:hypothetical protein